MPTSGPSIYYLFQLISMDPEVGTIGLLPQPAHSSPPASHCPFPPLLRGEECCRNPQATLPHEDWGGMIWTTYISK